MKKVFLLSVLLLIVAGQAMAWRYLIVDVTSKNDGWGWWNSNQYTDSLKVLWGPTDATVDSVIIVLSPFGKPILHDKSITLLATSASAGGDTLSVHLPEGIWCWIRMFDYDGSSWTAGPAKSLWIPPLEWNGFPVFGDYFCPEFNNSRIDTLDNYTILISGTKGMSNDLTKQEACDSVWQICGTKTLRIAHDYVQTIQLPDKFDKILADSCRKWFRKNVVYNPYYFSGDTTTLQAALDTLKLGETRDTAYIPHLRRSKLRNYRHLIWNHQLSAIG